MMIKPPVSVWQNPWLRAVLDSIEEPLWIISSQFKVVDCNRIAAERLPDNAGDYRGKICHRLIFDQHELCPFCCLPEIFRQGKSRKTNVSLLDKDGKNHVFELTFCPVREQKEITSFCLVIFRDITENVGLFAEISRLKGLAAMGQYASELTHEIRNPLNSIEIQMMLLKKVMTSLPVETRQQVSEIIEVVRLENQRLNSLAGEFLQVKKSRELVLSDVAIDELLRHIMDLVADDLATCQFRIELPDDGLPVRIRGDRDKLIQAFLNLIKNSLEAMAGQDGARLQIKISGEKSFIKVTFNDNGPGIPYENQPKIFKLFYTTKSSGTGIGLYLCKDIIEAHGGSISFISDSHGTTFMVKLPKSG